MKNAQFLGASDVEQPEHYGTVRCRKDGSLVDISLTVSPLECCRQGHGRV